MGYFLKSFTYAFKGLRTAFVERNFKIQFVVGVLALGGSFLVPMTDVERLLIVIVAAIVLFAEMTNTAVERLANFVSPEHHEDIRIVKDLTAAAVLLVSGAALIVGVWVFGKSFGWF